MSETMCGPVWKCGGHAQRARRCMTPWRRFHAASGYGSIKVAADQLIGSENGAHGPTAIGDSEGVVIRRADASLQNRGGSVDMRGQSEPRSKVPLSTLRVDKLSLFKLLPMAYISPRTSLCNTQELPCIMKQPNSNHRQPCLGHRECPSRTSSRIQPWPATSHIRHDFI